MKFIVFMLVFNSYLYAQDFESEAKLLVQDLKTSLVKNLTEKMTKEGPVKAVPFCHENVKTIAKTAAKERVTKYAFGRSSHKLRNPENAPQDWILPYLSEFKGKFKKDITKTSILLTDSFGKKIYMEPIYVEAKCLVCHGEKISPEIKNEISKLYPEDKAQGFKLGEFRGFIWVKEK